MNRTSLRHSIAPLVAAAAACFCLSGMAADDTATTTSPTLTKDQAKNLKTESDAQFKARKRVADANVDLNKADCETQLEGGVKSACKSSAKAAAKQDKADAKIIHEAEKADIKAQQKAN